MAGLIGPAGHTQPRDCRGGSQRATGKNRSLPEPRQSFVRTGLESEHGTGGIVLAANLDEAIAFVNEYAPEHLEVQTREPFAILPRLKNAGEILIGQYTPFSAGNYTVGTNAILPTGGKAHTYSSTSVYDFLKRTGIAYVKAEGYPTISATVQTLAGFEGLPSPRQRSPRSPRRLARQN